jgi:2-haloacid dehalogenase
MSHPIKAIIFDFGNVLVKWDAYDLYKRFFPTREAVNSFLQEIRFPEWNALQDAGRSFEEGISVLSQEFPNYINFIKAYDIYWEDSITEVYDDCIKIVERFNNEGFKIYLLSNFSVEKFQLMRERYDFLRLFDDIIISGEHKLIKPDPEIYLLTLKLIQLKPEECLFIDDSIANIKTAQDLGFNTIHFKSPDQLMTELQNLHLLTGNEL